MSVKPEHDTQSIAEESAETSAARSRWRCRSNRCGALSACPAIRGAPASSSVRIPNGSIRNAVKTKIRK